MSSKLTPLMKQYYDIKEKYQDTVLLFRMGDFFETFDNDAVITSKVCGIALTKRNNGMDNLTPLAGFPHHQLDTYLPKLVKAGYRVAVCEQLEDPKFAKGIVKRGVVEVVTPGLVLYDKLLDTKLNNYICAIYVRNDKSYIKTLGITFADISTGEFLASEIKVNKLLEILSTFSPNEIILSKEQLSILLPELEKLNYKPTFSKLEDWIFDYDFEYEKLLKQFGTINLKGFGIEENKEIIQSAGALLNYISDHQLGIISQITSIKKITFDDYITLDYSTRRNLEIIYSTNDGSNRNTLFSVVDKTITPMGGRLLKKWITMPLLNIEQIRFRQNIVQEIIENQDLHTEIKKLLNEVSDIERLISKICSLRANPRDCVALNKSIISIRKIKYLTLESNNENLKKLIVELNELEELISYLNKVLKDEPSYQIGIGNVFKAGWNSELDSYIEAKFHSKNLIMQYQEEERNNTGIQNLRISHNNVFGYYIELSKANATKAPNYYERRQTLANSERFTTPKLKELENKILSAEDKILELEQFLFKQVLEKIQNYTSEIQKNASIIANLDCLQSFSEVAIENNYCKPNVDDSSIIEIIDGRHPVVEKNLPLGTNFTPNSTFLDNENELIHIITGPNMSGKSCYIRQVGIIVLLAQIGSYVPAKSAKIGIVDKIFTRVGAQDNLSQGESTFLVEMQETANILNNATKRSLILLDEVGRGTATFDGISIAWAIAEYIHNHLGAKTLFATHYHELNDLESRYEKIKNYRIEVIETNSNIIFSHKVSRGASDYSFGIHVAKMAGLPFILIERANEIMSTLEDEKPEENENKKNKPNIKSIKTKKAKSESEQLAIFEFRDDVIREKLINLKVEQMTPIQALNFLMELQKEALNK